MSRTIFDTPVVNSLIKAFSVGFLKLTGWTVDGSLPPDGARSVLIAAPHTSNWDLPYTLMVAFALNLNVRWMGKQSIFRCAAGIYPERLEIGSVRSEERRVGKECRSRWSPYH